MRHAGIVLAAAAGLSLIGVACGRIALDQPLDDGDGGASGTGGQVRGTGGLSGAGGAAGSGGNAGVGGALGVGGMTSGPPCNQITDEKACLARSTACRADYCPSCPSSRFFRCANPSDPMPACSPPPPCIPLACASIKTLPECQALSFCHAVFSARPSGAVCPTTNSCAVFVACADGKFTPCPAMPQSLCGGRPPICAPGYVPSLNGACYEGCVTPDECALPIPP